MFKSASKINKFLTILGVGVVLAVLTACVSPQPTSPTGNAEASNGRPSAAVVTSGSQPAVTGLAPVYEGFSSARTFSATDGRPVGITVNGVGLANGVPDMATLNLGVEAFANTVESARDDAASAMGRIVEVLKANGVDDADIQTRFFNINPRFDRDRQNIIGFQVSNQLTVKIRDLESVGQIIDEATRAGGDLTRFQGLNFSIENTKPLEEQARVAAVEDMVAKARQLASLTGVTLGPPISITETGGFSPLRVGFAETAAFDQALGAPTPIIPGEVDVTVSLQAVFAIQ